MNYLDQLNHLSREEFTEIIGPLFEHSPWIAEKTWELRPFSTPEDLYRSLCEVLDAADSFAKVALIEAHPDLAGKLAVSNQLTEYSTAEQRSARLDRLTDAQFDRISTLNNRYRERFRFPFVICVKDHTQESIFTEFEERVENDRENEINRALAEIKRIAWHRLNLLLADKNL